MKPFNYSLNNFNCFTAKHVCKACKGIELLDLKTYFCTSDTDKHKKRSMPCHSKRQDSHCTWAEMPCVL